MDWATRHVIPKPTAIKIAKTLAENDLLTIMKPASGRRAALFIFEPLLDFAMA
jgi:hypothetical protein